MHLRGITVLACALLVAATEGAVRPRVHAAVHRKLQREGVVNLIVSMRDTTKPVLESLPHEASFASRGDLITNMVESLETHARTSQADITKLMAQEASSGAYASEMRSFWLTNQVYFRNATFELVEKLATVPGIASIEEDVLVPMPTLQVANTSSTAFTTSATTAASTPQWGISLMQAPEVWAKGYTGQGVVVASIDSGVRASHELLRGSYRKEFGWYDAAEDPGQKGMEAYDGGGHGTYCMGSMVGANGYGVAPGAKWITCKSIKKGEGGSAWSALIDCAQFMTCPTDPTGTTRDCSKAPHVVNIEAAGGRGVTLLDNSLAVWAVAGIFAVIPLGNNGPECKTAESPGDGNFTHVLSVGASDSSDGLAKFSDRGPSAFGGFIKPEITAPGDLVTSTAWGSDTATTTASGTSPASPHIGGTVALLLSMNPKMSAEEIRRRILDNADQASLKPTGQTCGNTVDGVFPNNMYGYGRVNALGAINGKRVSTGPGQCSRLTSSQACEAVFFCSWDVLQKTCQRWWN